MEVAGVDPTEMLRAICVQMSADDIEEITAELYDQRDSGWTIWVTIKVTRTKKDY
jgi:hypothetical protein